MRRFRVLGAALQADHGLGLHDTWIAATALVHGAEVWTQDRDFSNFNGLEIVRL